MGLKLRVKAALVAMAVVVILLPGLSHALNLEKEALVGLKGVKVTIEQMNPQAERLGLTRDQIKTDVELRLRKAGIRVLTNGEWLKVSRKTALYVNLYTFFHHDLPIVAFSIDVRLMELVTLAMGFRTVGSVWSIGGVGCSGIDHIAKLQENLGDAVDKFINDYLAANPK